MFFLKPRALFFIRGPLFLSLFLGLMAGPLSLAQNVPELKYLETTELYRKAIEGDQDSAYRMCLIYYYGDGKSYRWSDEDGKQIPIRDLRQAFIFCQSAANGGNTDSLYHFALLNLLDPEGDFQLGRLGADRQTGLRALRLAAEQGHSLAQFEMTKWAREESEIIYWEEQAARGGHIPSQYNMNMRSFFHEDSTKQGQAVEWFLSFSRQNIGKFGIYAIGHIATAYLRGQGGLEQNAIRAYAYQSLFVEYYPSCQDSDSFRQSLLAEFAAEGRLSGNDIAQALRLAQEIQDEIEREAGASLKRPYSTC